MQLQRVELCKGQDVNWYSQSTLSYVQEDLEVERKEMSEDFRLFNKTMSSGIHLTPLSLTLTNFLNWSTPFRLYHEPYLHPPLFHHTLSLLISVFSIMLLHIIGKIKVCIGVGI